MPPAEQTPAETAPTETAPTETALAGTEPADPGSGRTDRQPRRRLDADSRRAAILGAAMQAFATQPYPQASVAGIARAAEASEALVFRYYESKGGLYAAVIGAALEDLAQRQSDALSAIPAGAPARDRVRASLRIYLDHIASHPTGWSAPFLVSGNEPPPALEIRRLARERYVDALAGLLGIDRSQRRDEFSLWGYFGFLDAACLAWVHRGCLPEEREPLVEAALGALEGALGDWRR